MVNKIGITGWHGFIGSYLKEKIDKPVLFKGDLKILNDVKVFVKQCDRIYHVAGLNRADEGQILANNILATGNLILASKLQQLNPQIIFISSKQVEWNANSEYGIAKTIEESIVKMFNMWCIFRVPNVYGQKCKPFYNSVVATFAYQLTHNQKVTITNPNHTREFIFVEDLVEELLKPKFSVMRNIQGKRMSVGEIYDYLTIKLGQHEKLKQCLDYWRTHDIPITQR